MANRERVIPVDDWEGFTSCLESTCLSGPFATLIAMRDELHKVRERGVSTVPGKCLDYTIAYVAWRMAFLYDVAPDERQRLLLNATARLERLVREDPAFAEARCLLGGLYGVQIAKSPIRALLLGPRAIKEVRLASELEPTNPRVVLQRGVSCLHTPALYGGSLHRAERLFRESLELFEAESWEKSWPNWGRFDAHARLGQTLYRLGARGEARRQYETALELAPGSGWVRYSLLQRVDAPA